MDRECIDMYIDTESRNIGYMIVHIFLRSRQTNICDIYW